MLDTHAWYPIVRASVQCRLVPVWGLASLPVIVRDCVASDPLTDHFIFYIYDAL